MIKRLELLRHVAEQQGTLNTRQLAQSLGRDYKNVHTDVSALEEFGLIEKGEIVSNLTCYRKIQ